MNKYVGLNVLATGWRQLSSHFPVNLKVIMTVNRLNLTLYFNIGPFGKFPLRRNFRSVILTLSQCQPL